MGLIYISNARIPTEKAHGIQIMQMCAAFSSHNLNAPNKIEVELILPRRFNWLKEDPFEYYGIERNFKIRKLPCLDLIPFHKYLGHLGLWIESLTFFFSILFYVIFSKADIVYTRDRSILPLGLFKKNLILEVHTFPKNYFLYSFFFKRLKKVVVITQRLKESFLEKGMPQNKILVSPDGVDVKMFDIQCSKFEAREKLALPQDKKIILYTGHLYEWKGPQILAEASQFLPAEVEVFFVGGTEEDIKKYKIQNTKYKIQIIGHRPYPEIPYWLKAADVLVLPNSGKEEISRHWTSPLKMFEYMAAKRPIVANNLPSIREILNKGNAVLVEPDNAEALAQGIKEVLQNFQLSDKISAAAFQDVQQHTWRERVNKILAFINR